MRDQNQILYQSNGGHEEIRILYELANRSQISIDPRGHTQSRLVEHKAIQQAGLRGGNHS